MGYVAPALSNGPSSNDQPGRIVFLDGLRGWASLMVVFSHVLQVWLLNPEAMAQRGTTWLLSIINLTPLGVMMDGALAVHIFFAISGFVLAYPVLTSSTPSLTLAKLAVARYPRLTVPIIVSCLIAYLVTKAGGWHNVPAGEASASSWLRSFYRFDGGVLDLLRFVLWDVYFAYDTARSWNAVLWTMAIELKGSMALFLLLTVPSRPARLAIGIGLAASTLGTYYSGFFLGYLLAELMLGHGLGRRQVATGYRSGLGLALLAAALILAVLGRTPVLLGLETGHLGGITGKNIVAGLLLTGTLRVEAMRRLLETPCSRLLGRISFSLYLVHLPIICAISSWLFLALHQTVPFPATVLSVLVATLALSILAADLFSRLIEERLLVRIKAALARYVTRTFPHSGIRSA